MATTALLNDTTLAAPVPTTLIEGSSTLLQGSSTLLNPLPVGSGTTLVWQGGTSNNDPTVAANWNPAVAPQMAANQTLVMTHGTMELGAGNLAANQLNVVTAPDKTATIDLTSHGSLDLNVAATAAAANAVVNMTGGGEAVLNVFTAPASDPADPAASDPNITVNINASTLDLQANMSFGKLSVHGGTTFLQGDSHLNGTSVLLDTTLAGSGSIELASSAMGAHPGRMELTQSPLPVGVTVSALEHASAGGANGLILDAGSASTTPGGLISLQDAFVKVRGLTITSYTQQGNEYDLFNNGTKVDALDIVSAPGSNPLQVGSNANGVYIYNANPSTMPLGAGNGMGGGGGGGGMNMALVATAAPSLTPLPLHM